MLIVPSFVSLLRLVGPFVGFLLVLWYSFHCPEALGFNFLLGIFICL